MRMCVVTREKMPKKDLIRVVYFNDTFTVDKSGKLPKIRGIWGTKRWISMWMMWTVTDCTHFSTE